MVLVGSSGNSTFVDIIIFVVVNVKQPQFGYVSVKIVVWVKTRMLKLGFGLLMCSH